MSSLVFATFFICLLNVQTSLSLTAPSCPMREYCVGHVFTGLPIGSDATQRLQHLRDTFCGCVIVGGSVNIFLNNSQTDVLTEDDFNFLYHVKEIWGAFQIQSVYNASIHLPNLVLVRGEEQSAAGFAFGVFESTLNELNLPQFRELSRGKVLVKEAIWCGVTTVEWRDIIEGGSPVEFLPENLPQAIDEHCEPIGGLNCSDSCSSGHCWSYNHCQTLNKVVCDSFCEGGRCAPFSTHACCDKSLCASGCVSSPTDCIACKNFVENGTCVDQCTRKETFDSVGMLVYNPEGTVQAGDHLCLPSCPAGLFEKRGFCVESCGEGFFVSNGVCEQCVGECPNGVECDGWDSTEEVEPGATLDQFLNQECAVVNGHVRINSITIEAINEGRITEEMLERFSFVQVIRGQLLISFWDNSLPEMNFFRNVEYIGGPDLFTEVSDGFALSFHVNLILSQGAESGIRRIDLSKLKRITHGNVSLISNPQLCYYGDFHHDVSQYFQFESQRVLTRSVFGLDPHLNTTYCESIGFGCHSECNQSRWCWGPEDTNCVQCVNFYYEPLNRCVVNCDEYNDTFPNTNTKICEQCHEQCIGCYGAGPFNCKVCRNFSVLHNETTVECVGSCPSDYYLNVTTSVCVRCHELCVDGCTGPGMFVGAGGCNSCRLVNFNATFSQISCVEDCPVDTYISQLSQLTDGVPEDNLFCGPCHNLCLGCTGPTDQDCLRCRFVTLPNTTDDANHVECLTDCPMNFYTTAGDVCHVCHEECIGCTGAGPQDCLMCRNFRTQVQLTGEYECVSSCTKSDYVDVVDGVPTCVRCDPACQQCIGPGPSNCTECATNNIRDSEEVKEILIPTIENGTEMFITENVTVLTCRLSGAVQSTDATELPWYYILLLGGGLPLVFILFLIALGFLGYRMYVRNKGSKVKDYEGDIPIMDNPMYDVAADLFIKPTMLPQPKVAPNLAKITIVPEDSLQLLEELGSGAFGTVYKGYWQPEGEEHQYTVAIKVLNTSSPEANQELLEEGVAMASMDHSNVVRLYALCMGEDMMLVSQFVMMGSLLSFLRKHKDNLNAMTMMTFIHQIADGMSYLEEKRMVHRDLAARNVLVQSYENVKITDFGLTKCLDVGETGYKGTGGKVPVRWLAPECLLKREYSHKSDVWAYGVTVWEILTFGGRPYADKTTKEVVVAVNRGTRLNQPSTCSLDLYKNMLSCWWANPDSRPDFATLATTFAHFCSDPARYVSTTVDAQLEDYNSLPVNDAAIVDACVYETPGDPLTFSEPGEYDNPDGNQFKYSQDGTYDNPEFSAEPMDYTNPDDVTEEETQQQKPQQKQQQKPQQKQQQKPQQKQQKPASYKLRVLSMSSDKKMLHTNIDDVEVAEYCEEDDNKGGNEYDYIPDEQLPSDATVVANEYTYIDDQELEGTVQNQGRTESEMTEKRISALKSRFEKTTQPKDTPPPKSSPGKSTSPKEPSPPKSLPGKKIPTEKELSRMEDYVDEYPEWNTVQFNPLMNRESGTLDTAM